VLLLLFFLGGGIPDITSSPLKQLDGNFANMSQCERGHYLGRGSDWYLIDGSHVWPRFEYEKVMVVDDDDDDDEEVNDNQNKLNDRYV